uniref:N-terminal methionine N(alpha)-acetyltransferase NatC n=1 Tax=Dendroctonus ponderosae TaxID=77166 RepID=J3JV71_DENPD|nr:unknown [Dendroctonus ponderosae]
MSLNHGGEAVELHGDIIDLKESSAILQLHPKPSQDDDVNNVDKSKRKSKKRNKKHKQLIDANEILNGAQVEEINHQKNSDSAEFSNELSSDSNVVNCMETLPSCSTAPNRSSDTICDSLSTGIEALGIQDENSVTEKAEENHEKIDFDPYDSELQMPMIMKIIQKDLSEPYSIYTYRYFIHNCPKLCFLAMCEGQCVGAIVCKLDLHRKVVRRGYIAMLAVDQKYRKLRIGSSLVQMAIHEMTHGDADEVVLETEVTNKPALKLYEKLGFVRDKRLFRYYLNGVDALRLKLWLR